jgi:hypothetical protein
MEAELPDFYGAMVRASRDTYVQLIYTVRMPAYHRGAACLIGDAGAVAQPFTGSGVFKGYNNVESLLEVFGDHDDPVAALEDWDQEQVRLADRLLALGDQMEQAFILDSLDLTTADASSTEAWWHASVQFPDDFTYESKRLTSRRPRPPHRATYETQPPPCVEQAGEPSLKERDFVKNESVTRHRP